MPGAAAEHGLDSETLTPFAYHGRAVNEMPFSDLQPLLNPPLPERPYLSGERIEHEEFGWGVIQNVRQTGRGVQISVHFESGTETKFLASTAPISRTSILN